MRTIIDFLRKSNHGKHLLGGFLVGLLAMHALVALYVSAVAASCLEFKDKEHGGRWDWTDWGLTVLGGALASTLWLFYSYPLP